MRGTISKWLGATIIAAPLCGASGAALAVDITGAGATFPYPIYAKWADTFKKQTNVSMNYQSIGSGGGIKQIQAKTVDFGASDMPLKPDELDRNGLIQFPAIVGGDVIVHNIKGIESAKLKLTGPVVADIFLGKVTKWNAPEIAALNKGVALPNKDILVVHRSDASGTSYIFTDYLTKVSPAWASGPGKGKAVQWPVGLGGQGNEGVAGQVKQIPGSIGYVELAYARQNKLPYAAIKNASGEFVEPTIESITAAAAGAASKLPPTTDFRVSIVDAAGKGAYPISSFTFLLVSVNQADPVKGKKLVDFIRWALHDGEKEAAALDYAPLPTNVVSMLDTRLNGIKNVAK